MDAFEDEDGDFGLVDDDELFKPMAAPGAVEDEVHDGFERDIEAERELSIEFRKMSGPERIQAQRTFYKSRLASWAHATKKERRSFLHMLAYSNNFRHTTRPGQPSLQWLMVWAMRLLPGQMGKLDNSKRTPLTDAISSSNEIFVQAYIREHSDKVHSEMRQALRTAECVDHDNDREVTCLHAAITAGLRSELTLQLIQRVPNETFCMRDSKGRTPLHLAVDYERASPDQVRIVSELLPKSSEALEITTRQDSLGRRLSPYQHHESTRRIYESRNPRAAARPGPAEKTRDQDKGGRNDDNMKDRAKLQAAKDDLEELKKGASKRPPQPSSKLDPFGDAGPEKMGIKRRETGIGAHRDMLLEVNTHHGVNQAKGAHSTGSPIVQPRSSAEIYSQREEERKTSADKIREELKLAYLRTKRPRIAFQCLHIHEQRDKKLWFSFGPKSKAKISHAEFESQFEHLEFEEVLQYVEFPQIELIGHEDAPESRYPGRVDMIFFFNWLRSKKVKRIVKVIVDDLGDTYHSEEVIEEALKGFGVEALDWRRLDLCPVAISKVSENLREIHLQWSEKNTTLRAWSATDGLARTPTLKEIHLTQTQALDSERRIQQNLSEFKKRLDASWPPDKTHKPILQAKKASGDTLHTSAGQPPPGSINNGLAHYRESNVDPHKWIQCMDEFAMWFRKIKDLHTPQTDRALNPITVALIDDGVDIAHEDLRSKKLPGKSFNYYQDDWLVSPYWDSDSGYGTLMARLIQRVCPSAVIYVIKLKTTRPHGSAKVRINASSAIQAIHRAIEHATELKAQIISMSWTVKPPENSDERTSFDNAIKAASEQGALMFCAASDGGHSQEDFTYPHGSNPKLTFRIGAAKSTGNVTDFVGDYNKIDFAFPGHDVVVPDSSDGTGAGDFANFESHTGSSVATVLASGLAALILECVRLGVVHTNLTQPGLADPTVAIRKEDLRGIRDRERMAQAFRAIPRAQQTYPKYVEVRDTFKGVAEALKKEEGDRVSQLKVIAGLAWNLLAKGVR
ncbi:hypothetical protein B0T22DRAFT_377342 [Podospora appendiculata]|uniref:Peptidase S8/S53 domain-containing protein n=1 Tax=Podospora appendiculata TaxID=314037 RepID=A0AAE0X8U7_9PEZI|nr:hypothetical protein B0T22DRAFT_377342 [Podospora appendiculata]